LKGGGAEFRTLEFHKRDLFRLDICTH
jgi:hypothetical protein